MSFTLAHSVIILNRGSMPHKRTGKSDAIIADRNVQRHCLTSLETARSLANGTSWGEGDVCVLCFPGIAASMSMEGVCGRSLTAGKILFTGRQTCSLYLVL